MIACVEGGNFVKINPDIEAKIYEMDKKLDEVLAAISSSSIIRDYPNELDFLKKQFEKMGEKKNEF